ncbi:MAG TPA: hypothetical protein VNE38_04495 [Ktedonobacteraceae bacterium]|nr:hypothetical protein [Ktedonobacteraceae bacterium]
MPVHRHKKATTPKAPDSTEEIKQSNKHRRKADAPSPQDLTARENAARDSKVVKKREPGTLEMTQDEQQKTPPPEPPFPAGCLFAETHHASAVSRPGSEVARISCITAQTMVRQLG